MLLPLFICCSAVTRHPLFLSGVGLFAAVIFIGFVLTGFHTGAILDQT